MAIDFVTEFKKLQKTTPRLNRYLLSCTNSDYSYNCENVKNGYLLANACEDEDCMYGRDFYGCKNCNDCDHIRNCTLCYQCLNCENCYNCDYLQDSVNCSDCRFGYYLKGCQNCIGCINLKQKKFHIFNESYSEADYRARLTFLTNDEIKLKFQELQKKMPRIGIIQIDCENCNGNSLFHCKNIHESFDAVDCEDCSYVLEAKKLKNCFDITILENAELCYQISSSHVLNNCNFCFFCVECSDVEYGECLISCHNCFGCISLHRKQYYILNKPYSKEEYFKKITEIKDQLRAQGLYGQIITDPCFPRKNTVLEWDRM